MALPSGTPRVQAAEARNAIREHRRAIRAAGKLLVHPQAHPFHMQFPERLS
jgi:hypothetical protein